MDEVKSYLKGKELNKKEPDFYVRMVLSSYEAALVRAVRKYRWSKIKVIVQHGQPRRAEIEESINLTEEDGAAANVESKIAETEFKHPIIDEVSSDNNS